MQSFRSVVADRRVSSGRLLQAKTRFRRFFLIQDLARCPAPASSSKFSQLRRAEGSRAHEGCGNWDANLVHCRRKAWTQQWRPHKQAPASLRKLARCRRVLPRPVACTLPASGKLQQVLGHCPSSISAYTAELGKLPSSAKLHQAWGTVSSRQVLSCLEPRIEQVLPAPAS